MAQVYAVSRMVEFVNGSRTVMVLRVYDEKAEAEQFIRTCQGEMGALLQAGLVAKTPRGPQMVGSGKTMYDCAGIAAIAYTLNETEVHGAIEKAPAGRLVVPS